MTVDLHSPERGPAGPPRPRVLDHDGPRVELPPGLTPDEVTRLRPLLQRTEELARRCEQLQIALDSRIVVEQAKGILAERLHVTVDEAFRILRRSSRSNRLRIHDLAARVVSSAATPPELAWAERDGDAAGAERAGNAG